MEYLLLHFGYVFLVLGLIIEGDATLVAAVILAGSGHHYLSLRWVLALALGVTVAGNELLYSLGSMGWLSARVGTGKHYRRASRWLHSSRGGYLALLFSRFMWGFRLMIPVAAGLLHIRRRRFSLANLFGGAIWVGLLAYFGVAIQSLLGLVHEDFLRYQSHIAVAVFLAGLIIGLATIPWQIVRRGSRRAAIDRQFTLGALLARSVPHAHGQPQAVRRKEAERSPAPAETDLRASGARPPGRTPDPKATLNRPVHHEGTGLRP